MKTTSLFISALLLCTTTFLHAQEPQQSLSYIGISVGPSIATGDFSKTETGTFGKWNNQSGFAKTAYAINVEGAWYFLPQFGLTGSVAFSDHGSLNASDVTKLGDSFTDAFGVDNSTVNSKNRYRSLNVMAGPTIAIPVHKFIFEIRGMAGIVQSLSTPRISVQLEDGDPFYQNSSTATAFAWQAGAGMRYPICKKLQLSLRADYVQSSDLSISNSNRVNNAGRYVTKQPMSWINTMIGVAYTL
jgi:hypothetical protein